MVNDGEGGYDYIMAADVIGFPAVLDILANTLHALIFSSQVTVRTLVPLVVYPEEDSGTQQPRGMTQKRTQCVLSYKVRDKRVEASFLEKMAAKGFRARHVPHRAMHPSFRAESIHIVTFTRPDMNRSNDGVCARDLAS